MTDWPPTRAEGDRLLAAFKPRMGRRYATGRNTDLGPGAHTVVSVLSPYVQRRLVLESDAVAAALVAHGPDDAEKFVQEVKVEQNIPRFSRRGPPRMTPTDPRIARLRSGARPASHPPSEIGRVTRAPARESGLQIVCLA